MIPQLLRVCVCLPFSAQSVIQSGLANCERQHCYRDIHLDRQRDRQQRGATEPQIEGGQKNKGLSFLLYVNSHVC